MTQVLIEAHPACVESGAFERDRERINSFGIDVGPTPGEIVAFNRSQFPYLSQPGFSLT
jgi:hypothetical protein